MSENPYISPSMEETLILVEQGFATSVTNNTPGDMEWDNG